MTSQSSREEVQALISQLDGEIAVRKSVRESICAALREEEAVLRVTQNRRARLLESLAPITKIPAEILAYIFVHGHGSDEAPERFTLLVASVSMKWRETALSTSVLWSTFTITNTRSISHASSFSERSHQRPLNVVLRIRVSGKYYDAFEETAQVSTLIREIICRIYRLSLIASGQSLQLVAAMLNGQLAPLLEYLAIETMDELSYDEDGEPILPNFRLVLNMGAPRLKTLCLASCIPRYRMTDDRLLTRASRAFNHIHRLQLEDLGRHDWWDDAVFSSTISAFPNLQHLVLVDAVPEMNDEEPIKSVSLRTLVVRVVEESYSATVLDRFLTGLQTPNLTCLEIYSDYPTHFSWQGLLEYAWEYGIATDGPVMAKLFPKLSTLRLDDPAGICPAIHLVAPMLRHISLRCHRLRPEDEREDHRQQYSGMLNDLCQHLETIELTELTKFEDKTVITRLIQNRVPGQIPRLSLLLDSTVIDVMDGEMRAWLDERVDIVQR